MISLLKTTVRSPNRDLDYSCRQALVYICSYVVPFCQRVFSFVCDLWRWDGVLLYVW
jgi:hypothetical protein